MVESLASNYSPWKVSSSQQSFHSQEMMERLRLLLKYAVLAPSSHNAQPWRFKINKNVVSFMFSEGRLLVHADREQRQAHIGLGCAIQNFLTAAAYYGYKTSVEYYVNAKLPVTITLIEQLDGLQNSDHLIKAMVNRTTNRNKYVQEVIDKSFLLELESIAKHLDLSLKILSSTQDLSLVATILVEALNNTMDNIEFRHELAGYLRHNRTSRETGIPMFGMGFSFLKSLVAPAVVRKINVARKVETETLDLITHHTPAIAVLFSDQDDKFHWMKVGRVYQEISLKLTERGYTTAPFTAPIESLFSRNLLAKCYDTKLYPQMCFRYGKPLITTAHSPRIAADKITTIQYE